MKIAKWMNVDPPVKPLVLILNSLPCVDTISCCGGHTLHPVCSQVPEGHFYVDCDIRNKKVIALLREFAKANRDFRIKRWNEGPVSGGWRYDLRGTHRAMRILEKALLEEKF